MSSRALLPRGGRGRGRSLAYLLILAAMAAAAATCGGTAIIDGPLGTGGAGGSSQGGEDGSPVCVTSDPVGEVFECGFGTTGSGMGPCERRICDIDGNEWRSSCEDQGCVCFYNGSVKCSCALQGEGTFCDGVRPSCCPEPFPPF
ncbi:MAG: hypothetical protein R3B72_02900 [Polyangiaceae bacterium]